MACRKGVKSDRKGLKPRRPSSHPGSSSYQALTRKAQPWRSSGRRIVSRIETHLVAFGDEEQDWQGSIVDWSDLNQNFPTVKGNFLSGTPDETPLSLSWNSSVIGRGWSGCAGNQFGYLHIGLCPLPLLHPPRRLIGEFTTIPRQICQYTWSSSLCVVTRSLMPHPFCFFY
ncbi:hypothetical protein BP00DRAFT_10193 [Aspergillus indologenus CBS 114.80]|uniref:Uncharacterized protein n=1 Tax=Aspergillus indologenus CBS 114.80 TaxID=1450541 RepID=A0A2V5J0I6_9EURO|nr:hypothetical protein BP00DRAFT_10193 [Aspergillus indologenus CBS 114.80]